MARKSLREPKIDTELAYAYAKTDRLHDMDDFLGTTKCRRHFGRRREMLRG
jgi:clathrin heavy chain